MSGPCYALVYGSCPARAPRMLWTCHAPRLPEVQERKEPTHTGTPAGLRGVWGSSCNPCWQAERNGSDPLAVSPAVHPARSNLTLPCNGQTDPELGLCSMQYAVALDFT